MDKVKVMENRRVWAAALRSGKYTEHRGSWAPDFGSMMGPERDHPVAQRITAEGGPACCLMVALCVIPNINVARLGGLMLSEALGVGGLASFVDAMDVKRKSFSEIADMVDALPEPV